MELVLVSRMHSIGDIQEAVPQRNLFKNLLSELVTCEKSVLTLIVLIHNLRPVQSGRISKWGWFMISSLAGSSLLQTLFEATFRVRGPRFLVSLEDIAVHAIRVAGRLQLGTAGLRDQFD
jgi:hypothetical protein